MADSNLDKLSARGQSVWIDYLSRDLLEQGELKRMMEEDAVVGVTSNPTIFQKAISSGNAYDEQLKEVLQRQDDPKEIFLELSSRDVDAATDLLASVHERNAGAWRAAWRWHAASLLQPSGWRYLPYTRHLMRDALQALS